MYRTSRFFGESSEVSDAEEEGRGRVEDFICFHNVGSGLQQAIQEP